jgi:hypothetical protein
MTAIVSQITWIGWHGKLELVVLPCVSLTEVVETIAFLCVYRWFVLFHMFVLAGTKCFITIDMSVCHFKELFNTILTTNFVMAMRRGVSKAAHFTFGIATMTFVLPDLDSDRVRIQENFVFKDFKANNISWYFVHI